MYCPQCKAEYRPGFARCSDCSVELVYELPAEEWEEKQSAPLWPDAKSLSELWRGEDAVLKGQLLAELKRVGIPYETARTREAAGCGIDPIARGVEPRFGSIVRVQPKDSFAAREVLSKLLEAEKVDLSIPVDTSAAYEISQSKISTGVLKPVETEEYEAQEQKCVWEGNDALKRDFVRASLRECGIPSESSLQGQSYRVFVGEAAQRKAVATIKEIVEGTPPSFEQPDKESRAETSFTKYQLFFSSLATGLIAPVALLFLLQFVGDSYRAVQILKLLAGCAALGTLWTGYQALRYEKRPGLYLLMAILPFSFIWYYLGRYKPRTAEVTGPSFDQPPE